MADITQLVTTVNFPTSLIVYNCKLSDVINSLNNVRRWVRPIAGKISAQT